MIEPVSYLNGKVIVYGGDCIEVLAQLPENSVDAVCCDPPYHLTSIVKRFGSDSAAPAKAGATGAYQRASSGFMGKVWDGGDIAFQPATWAAVLRVLKPGGYLLAFASTRGFGRMSVAIEDAGFITHPLIAWIFATGFPKATRVKHPDYDGFRYGGQALKPAIEPIYMGQKPFSEANGTANVLEWGTGAINVDGCRVGVADNEPESYMRGERSIKMNRAASDSNSVSLPPIVLADSGKGRWPANLIHDGSDEVLAGFPDTASGSRKAGDYGLMGYHGADAAPMPAVDGDSGSAARFFASFPFKDEDLCTPSNASFAEPTFSLRSEHAVSALSNAVAQSMPGRALNSASYRAPSTTVTASELSRLCDLVTTAIQSIGKRFSHEPPPSKLTLSDSLAGVVVEQGQIDTIETTISLWKSYGSAEPVTFNITATSAELGEPGSSRLFYSSKADSEDRLGSKHPTVKPLDLMQYLSRLVTPPGGTVLDPFAGTGTTGEAAWREGFKAILIEREAEYLADIARRMELAVLPTKRAAIAKTKNNLMGAEGTPLFPEAAE